MKNINWKQSIVTAIITIIVTVIGGMLLYYFQYHKPKLEYNIEVLPSFNSDKENVSIIHLKVSNTGNDIAEDIKCVVDVKPATIKDFNINSNSLIELKTNLDSSKICFTAKNMNSTETYQASLLLTTNAIFPESPTVTLRGKGINGIPQEESNNEIPFIWILTFITIGTTLVSLTTRSLIKSKGLLESIDDKLLRDKLEKIDEGKHHDDQKHIIAYICGLHGLVDEVDRLLSFPSDVSYWSEVDRMTSKAINSDDKGLIDKIKLILLDLVKYASIAESSQGIIHYNLARLEKHQGNNEEADKQIAVANNYNSNIIKTRLEIDPSF